jgi:salicylate hydroxylase
VDGLTLAVALSESPNIEINVCEAARELAEIGAGVVMWPRTWQILHALGLADELSRNTDIPPQKAPSKLR